MGPPPRVPQEMRTGRGSGCTRPAGCFSAPGPTGCFCTRPAGCFCTRPAGCFCTRPAGCFCTRPAGCSSRVASSWATLSTRVLGREHPAESADRRRSQRVEGGVNPVLAQEQDEREHDAEDGNKSERDRDEAVDQSAIGGRWDSRRCDSSVAHLLNELALDCGVDVRIFRHLYGLLEGIAAQACLAYHRSSGLTARPDASTKPIFLLVFQVSGSVGCRAWRSRPCTRC